MKTTTEFEPVIDEPTEEVETQVAEAPTSSNKTLSVVEALRLTFCKPGKYVLNCDDMTDDEWNVLYAKEFPGLRGSGTPEWYYTWNYCTKCHSMLSSCKSNPYGFFGAIGKARREVQARHYVARTSAAPQAAQVTTDVVDEETGEVTQVVTTAPPKTRVANGTLSQVVPPNSQKDVRSRYLAGATIAGVSEEFKIANKAVRDFLAQEGVLRKQGEQFVPTNPSEQPMVRRGKPRTTFLISKELVHKVAKMLATGRGGGLVAIAKAENVNPNELSVALKAAGVVIRRGAEKGSFGARKAG